MNVAWGVQEVIQAAAQNKEQIASLVRRGWEYLLGKRTRLAFTGMQGVGKTVLLEYLSGAAFKPGYQPPLQSQRMESKTFRAGGARVAVGVIPGDASNPRYVA